MNSKTIGRYFGLALLGMGTLSANAGYIQNTGVAEAAAPSEVIDPAALNAVLPTAAERAQNSFDRFLENALVRGLRTGPQSAVRVETANGPAWLFDVVRTETGFLGHVMGETEARHFTRADVLDWSHSDHNTGRLHGNFASRAMMDILPPHRSALIAATLAIEPLPTGW